MLSRGLNTGGAIVSFGLNPFVESVEPIPFSPAPLERTIFVAAESRAATVAFDPRVVSIARESRTVKV